jgi:hypothetical protein
MKSVLSEIIKIELLKNVLSEGRVEDAKAKYPQDTEIVDYFVSQDPSGNNKYLPWMMKTYNQIPSAAPEGVRQQAKELIPQLIVGFHQNIARIEKKDINQYKSLAELHVVVNPLIKASEEKVVKKEKEEKGVKKYYEDDEWLLLQPLTHESSCKYGANTKWCVASRGDSHHYKSYTKTGLLVFLIHKKSNHKFAFYTDEADETYIEIYNPLDTDVAGSGDISIKEFLKGLVDGEMQSYLDIDEEGFGEDGDDDWRFYKIKEDGTIKQLFNEYDEDDVVYSAVDKIWSYFFGKGSGRNTVEKFTRIFALFGYTVDLGKKVKGQGIPWTIYRIGTKPNGSYEGDDFMDYFKDEIFDDFVSDEIVSNWDAGDVITFIRNNNLPFVLERDGVSTSSSNEDYNNIMSEEQAKAIYNKYIEIRNLHNEEHAKNTEKIMSEIISRVKIPKNSYEIIKPCLDAALNSKEEHARKLNTFQNCLTKQLGGKSTHTIPIGLVNPSSGRTLRRSFLDVWRLFQKEEGHAEYNKFSFDFYSKIFNNQKNL